jgi:hypothetical protein
MTGAGVAGSAEGAGFTSFAFFSSVCFTSFASSVLTTDWSVCPGRGVGGLAKFENGKGNLKFEKEI